VIAALLGVVLLAAVTAFASAKSAKKSVSGSVSIVGVWTGDEEKSFNAVLAGFKKQNPNVKVSYKSSGDNTPTVLATA
jgi:alpha-glucoside transport system substrate-binding protein